MTTQDEQRARARLLCDDVGARAIAGRLDAPSFDDSEKNVQDYWLALASSLAFAPDTEAIPQGMGEGVIQDALECATYLDGYAVIVSDAMYGGRRPSGIWQLERAARLLRSLAASLTPAPSGDALREVFEIAQRAPELNMSNYDYDQVAELNAAMIEIWSILKDALKPAGDKV